jgi:hypothetical protein
MQEPHGQPIDLPCPLAQQPKKYSLRTTVVASQLAPPPGLLFPSLLHLPLQHRC